MNIQREYLLAAIPEPVRVFGLKLLPFCIGHHLLLDRLESPIVSGETPDLLDVFLAVWVCAHTYEDGLSAIDSNRYWDELGAWRRKIARRTWWGLRPLSVEELTEKIKLFTDYITAAQMAPKLFVDEGGKPVGSPSLQVLKVRLMKELHLSESTVLNRPLALCWWDYATLIELDGHGKVYDRDEYAEAQRKADAFTERLARQ